MASQDTFATALDQFGEVGKSVEIDPALLDAAAASRAQIVDFEVLIPLVGPFSAGKTSLVNAWLKRPHDSGLPTDTVAQTALATEIRAAASADEEHIDLYGEGDNLVQKVNIGQFKAIEKTLKIDQPQAQYAKAYLHSEHLAASDRKVLVDMPGLDSGLSTHNAAIQRYLPLGSYFVMVVDANVGTLRNSEIRQLREFLDQEVEFTVLVNKIDTKATEAAAIVDHIQGQVRHAFGKCAPVHPVSAYSDDVRAFAAVVAGVDFDRALTTFWRDRVLALFNDAARSLRTRYGAYNVSTAESDQLIAELQRKKEALEQKFRDDEQQIQRYSARAVGRILREVRDAIRDQASTLAKALQDGGETAMHHELNEIVRQTLNRTMGTHKRDIMEEIARNYQGDFDGLRVPLSQFMSDRDAGAGLVTDLMAVPAASAVLPPVNSAIPRDIVALLLKIIVAALPAILEFFFGRRRREEEQARRAATAIESLKTRIRTDIAPKIASTLRPEVAQRCDKIAREMIEQLRQNVNALVAGVEKDINKSREEIKALQVTADQRKAELRAAIEALTKARQPLEIPA